MLLPAVKRFGMPDLVAQVVNLVRVGIAHPAQARRQRRRTAPGWHPEFIRRIPRSSALA